MASSIIQGVHGAWRDVRQTGWKHQTTLYQYVEQDNMLAFVFSCMCAAACISAGLARLNDPLRAKPVIIDTDLYADVDDVGALAIANILHICGLCDIRGIGMSTRSRYGALAVRSNLVSTCLVVLLERLHCTQAMDSELSVDIF